MALGGYRSLVASIAAAAAVAGCCARRAPASPGGDRSGPAATTPGLPRGFVAITGGAIKVHRQGAVRPGRQIVVLVHDWGQDAGVFYQQVAALRSRYAVVTYDLRGHGSSTDDAGRGGAVRDHADDLARVIDSVAGEAGTVHLVGHGLGALIALDHAARHASRVRSLTVIGAVAALPADARKRYRDLTAELARDPASYDGWGSRLIPIWLSRGFLERRPDAVGLFDAMLAGHDPVSVAATLDRTVDYELAVKDLGAVAAPTLVLYGVDDKFPGAEDAERMLGGLRDVTRIRIPGAGHAPHVENADAVNAALARHLAGT